MPEQTDANNSGEAFEDGSLSPLIRAYIDQQIQNSKEADERSRKKKWKNSWRSASPITKGTFILGGAVAFATVAYSIIAGFELVQMKRTNGLTEEALQANAKSLEAANKANELSATLVKGEYAAIVDMTIPSDPDSLSQIAAGLSAQFVNKGKVDATNFSTTATFQKVSLPGFEPKGTLRTVTIAQPRILPLSGGHGGLESVASATFDVSDLGEPDIASVKSETTTFKMIISYSYGDGFGDTINNTRCFLYLYVPPQPPSNQMWNSWDECTMAMNVYRSHFRHK